MLFEVRIREVYEKTYHVEASSLNSAEWIAEGSGTKAPSEDECVASVCVDREVMIVKERSVQS